MFVAWVVPEVLPYSKEEVEASKTAQKEPKATPTGWLLVSLLLKKLLRAQDYTTTIALVSTVRGQWVPYGARPMGFRTRGMTAHNL